MEPRNILIDALCRSNRGAKMGLATVPIVLVRIPAMVVRWRSGLMVRPAIARSYRLLAPGNSTEFSSDIVDCAVQHDRSSAIGVVLLQLHANLISERLAQAGTTGVLFMRNASTTCGSSFRCARSNSGGVSAIHVSSDKSA
jgi:hypothetical protein